MGQRVAVRGEERTRGGEQIIRFLGCIGECLVGTGQAIGELRQVLVQRGELLVVAVQGVDEQRQAAHHREQVAAALV